MRRTYTAAVAVLAMLALSSGTAQARPITPDQAPPRHDQICLLDILNIRLCLQLGVNLDQGLIKVNPLKTPAQIDQSRRR